MTPEQSQLVSAFAGNTCAPIPGDMLLSLFSLSPGSKWSSIGFAALSFPVLCVVFYLGLRFARHEKR
jgi:hypothetical protein